MILITDSDSPEILFYVFLILLYNILKLEYGSNLFFHWLHLVTMKMLIYEAHKWRNNDIIGLVKHNTMLVDVRETEEDWGVRGVSPSILPQCPAEDMWLWLCEPWGSLQTMPCVSKTSQGLDSWAQLRPPNWESNQKRSVGTSCWMAHDPAGWDPCLGHVQSCDPLTNWWEGDSHILTYKAASTSPSNSSSTIGIVNV